MSQLPYSNPTTHPPWRRRTATPWRCRGTGRRSASTCRCAHPTLFHQKNVGMTLPLLMCAHKQRSLVAQVQETSNKKDVRKRSLCTDACMRAPPSNARVVWILSCTGTAPSAPCAEQHGNKWGPARAGCRRSLARPSPTPGGGCTAQQARCQEPCFKHSPAAPNPTPTPADCLPACVCAGQARYREAALQAARVHRGHGHRGDAAGGCGM